MLFTLGHGQHIVVEPPLPPVDAARRIAPATEAQGDVVALSAVVDLNGSGTANAARSLDAAPPAPLAGGPFDYYFAGAPDIAHAADTAAKLDALADAMVEADDDPEAQNSAIPPVFTYFGQFIDHDITANTDREAGLSTIDGDLAPLPRPHVVQNLLNLRNGALELDSVYGDGPDQGAFSKKLARLMRHPSFRGKMRLGVPTPADANRPPLPADPAADLLRLGRILGNDPNKNVSLAELNALPAPLKDNFLDGAGQPIVQKAIIGDARNDENLIVAQFHCAVLRFHNKVVDAGGIETQGMTADALFDWARQRVRWHYQWLVVNAYLPAICDPAVVAAVRQAGAPLYSAFFARHPYGSRKRLPLPLEFSVAGFRFGHSMVRAAYDHNRFFGRPEDGSPTLIGRAPFDLLFAFTGNGHPPMPKPDGSGGSQPTLPTNWIIEWDRFATHDPAFPDRSARMIDTRLAPPLSTLANETAEPVAIFKHLARRNLRRGHKLNIPSAQACIAGINATNAAAITPLSAAELTADPRTGPALLAGGFETATPLWFYVLKEAEAKAGGAHLGALGSTLVAETLIGLVVNDPTSYWHQPGSDGGRWHPQDGVRPGGILVDSIPAFFRAAGLL